MDLTLEKCCFYRNAEPTSAGGSRTVPSPPKSTDKQDKQPQLRQTHTAPPIDPGLAAAPPPQSSCPPSLRSPPREFYLHKLTPSRKYIWMKLSKMPLASTQGPAAPRTGRHHQSVAGMDGEVCDANSRPGLFRAVKQGPLYSPSRPLGSPGSERRAADPRGGIMR